MKFFEDLKTFILGKDIKILKKLIPHYENLRQNKEHISELIEDYEKYNSDIRYEKDETGGYTDGKLEIYLFEDGSEGYGYSIGYRYEINLLRDERYHGYCDCEGECSGYGCDWVAPEFSLNKMISVTRNAFKGYERDIWELSKEWDKHLEKYKEEEKQLKLDQLNKRLEELTKQKEALLNT